MINYLHPQDLTNIFMIKLKYSLCISLTLSLSTSDIISLMFLSSFMPKSRRACSSSSRVIYLKAKMSAAYNIYKETGNGMICRHKILVIVLVDKNNNMIIDIITRYYLYQSIGMQCKDDLPCPFYSYALSL